ncbi:phage integrase family site specific recombinase [Yersinia pseudotuberculosis]|nr:phage integrase family site specific recombinase [Yersinia pseudotuberculosis]
MPLSDRQIRRAKPQEKAYPLSDGQGLSLLIEPNGSKGWRFRYRFAGKARLMSLGIYDLVSLAEARCKRNTQFRSIAAKRPATSSHQRASRGRIISKCKRHREMPLKIKNHSTSLHLST